MTHAEASKLDTAAKAFGEFNLYVGDDGKITTNRRVREAGGNPGTHGRTK